MIKTPLFPKIDPKLQFAFLKEQEAVPVIIPLAKWQEAANIDLFTDQPRKR